MTHSEVEVCRKAKEAFHKKFNPRNISSYLFDTYGINGYGIGDKCVVVNFREKLHPDIPDEINGVKIDKRIIGSLTPRTGENHD